MKTYEGKYWSDELEMIYSLHINNGELVIQNRWLGMVKLQTISEDFFRSNKDYYVKFVRNKEGKIKGLSVNSKRTLNVYFHRIE